MSTDINKILNEEVEEVELHEERVAIVDTEDFFSAMEEDLDEFEEISWNKGDGYSTPRFPMLTQHLEGFDNGLILLPAESNAGKSAIMMNIVEDMVMHEPNKLFGIYFSLDDSKHEIIPRVIAMREGIQISTVAKPQRVQNMIDKGAENADE